MRLKLISSAVLCSALLAAAAQAQEDRILWLSIGDNPTNLSGLTTKITTAKAAGYNAVCYLSRYRANAYYVPNRLNSTYTNNDPMASGVTTSNDPTQHVIDVARANGMRVYAAWPTLLVSDGSNTYPAHLPSDGRQYAYRRTGSTDRSVYLPDAAPAPQTTSDNGDGLWMDPAVPSVVSYQVSVISDFVSNYDVDGILLDRIRFPDRVASGGEVIEFGYNPTSLSAYGLTNPAPSNSTFTTKRREAVANLIDAMSDAVQGIKPWIIMGSTPVVYGSTLADTYSNVYQHFPTWNSYSNPRHTSGLGLMDVVMPQYYRSTGSTNDTLMGLAAVDLTNQGHMATLRSITLSGDTDLAVIGARAADNVCDTRTPGYNMGGFGMFSATTALDSSFVTAFEAQNTSCGTDVIGTPATNYQFTIKSGWDGVAPNPVSGLAATSPGTTIDLTWNVPAAAADSDTASRYLIYASTTTPVDLTWANLINKNIVVEETQFKITPELLSDAGSYHVAVVAVDEYNNKSTAVETTATLGSSFSVLNARTLIGSGYADNFTGTQNSTAASAAPGNAVGAGSRFSVTPGEVATYQIASVASDALYSFDITTDNQASHNANASWVITTPERTVSSTSNLLIRGTGSGNFGDAWFRFATVK